MHSKYHWQNFSREKELEKLAMPYIAELQGKTRSSPKVQGQNKEHTAGEIKRAEEHAASSSHKDKCIKGKACNAACIYYKDDCIITFPDPGIQKNLSQVRDLLRAKVSRGELNEEEAARVFKKYSGLEGVSDPERELRSQDITKKGTQEWDKELKKEIEKAEIKSKATALTEAYNELEKAYPDPVEREKAFNRTLDGILESTYGVKDVGAQVGFSEVEGIYKLQSRIKEATEVYNRLKSGEIKNSEELKEALAKIAQDYRVHKVSDAEVKLAMALMPADAINYLRTAGTVKEGGLFPPGSKSDTIPSSYGPVKGASKEYQDGRAELLTRIALESGFRDIYTGEKISLMEADLEHIIPASMGGRMSEQGYNYGLTKSRLNRGKGEKSPDYFLTDNPQGYFSVDPSGKNRTNTKFREPIEFDSNGKLTPRGKELHTVREREGVLKKDIEGKVLNKNVSPTEALAVIESSGLPSDQKAKLVGKVISLWTEGAARTAAVGMQSAKPGKLARERQPWYWYGGPSSAGGNPAGQVIARKVAELQGKGDTAGLQKLAAIMAEAQRRILDLNNQEWNGTLIKDLEMDSETGSRKAVAAMIAEIRESTLPAIAAL